MSGSPWQACAMYCDCASLSHVSAPSNTSFTRRHFSASTYGFAQLSERIHDFRWGLRISTLPENSAEGSQPTQERRGPKLSITHHAGQPAERLRHALSPSAPDTRWRTSIVCFGNTVKVFT